MVGHTPARLATYNTLLTPPLCAAQAFSLLSSLLPLQISLPGANKLPTAYPHSLRFNPRSLPHPVECFHFPTSPADKELSLSLIRFFALQHGWLLKRRVDGDQADILRARSIPVRPASSSWLWRPASATPSWPGSAFHPDSHPGCAGPPTDGLLSAARPPVRGAHDDCPPPLPVERAPVSAGPWGARAAAAAAATYRPSGGDQPAGY